MEGDPLKNYVGNGVRRVADGQANQILRFYLGQERRGGDRPPFSSVYHTRYESRKLEEKGG